MQTANSLQTQFTWGCAKAIPSAMAFIRCTYASLSGIDKPIHHDNRHSNGIKDHRMWHPFLYVFISISYMQDKESISANTLNLQTDSAGGSALGCGVIYPGLTSGQNLIF